MRRAVPPVERSTGGADQVDKLVRHAEELDRHPLLGVQEISDAIPATAGVHVVRHGLNRAYSHAWVTGTLEATTVFALTPAGTTAAGYDTRAYVVVYCPVPPGADMPFNMLVF